MRYLADRSWTKLQKDSAAAHEAARRETQEKLEVNVVFTRERGTLAALRAAGKLALDLDAHLNLLVAQVVPVFFPLTRPPVAVSFTEHRLVDLVCRGTQGSPATAIRLYLCRDRKEALLQALRPKSLVVIGCRKRWWWPTAEADLAEELRSKGHQVILVDPE